MSLPLEKKKKLLINNTSKGLCIVKLSHGATHACLFGIAYNWENYYCIITSKTCEIFQHCFQRPHKVTKRERNGGGND